MTRKIIYTMSDVQVDNIRRLQSSIHEACVDAGWYTDLETGEYKPRDFGVAVALMHTELSEAYEAHRKNLMDDHLPHREGIEVELADCIIRILDTAEAEGLDIGKAIQEKFAYNQKREDHTLEHRRRKGGKKT